MPDNAITFTFIVIHERNFTFIVIYRLLLKWNIGNYELVISFRKVELSAERDSFIVCKSIVWTFCESFRKLKTADLFL